jgi:hypothetical protein
MGVYILNVREPLHVGTLLPVTSTAENSSHAAHASVGMDSMFPSPQTIGHGVGACECWSSRSRPIGRVADTGNLDNIWWLAGRRSPDQTHVWGNQPKNGCESKSGGVYVH